MKRCPYCAEEIQDPALVCKHCGRDLATGRAPGQARLWHPGVAGILSLIIPGLGHLYRGLVVQGLLWFLATAAGYLMLIIPGLILHAVAIVAAVSGDPYETRPTRPPAAYRPPPPAPMPRAAIWIAVIGLALVGVAGYLAR